MRTARPAAVSAGGILAGGAGLLVALLRAAFVAVLLLLQPVVSFICAVAMLLGLFVAVLFEISVVGPTFSFLGMVGASLAFGLVLILYNALIAWLLR